MANIVLSANTTSINVDTTTSNVDVTTSTSTIKVGETTFVANNLVRAAISVANNGGDGSLSYDEPTGVITYNGVTAAETRAHFSGSNGVDYNSSTGAITADSAEIRALLSNVAPITYNASTGVIGLEQTLDDLTLKKYQETVVNNGTLSGDISVNIADGTIHQVTLTGDITGITLANISTGGSATILLTQDGIGGSTIDTTTTPSNWTNWNFTNEFTALDATADAWSALNVLYDGSEYYATVITGSGTIDNATLEIIKAYIETNGLDMENTVTSNSNISSTANISANTFKTTNIESQGALDVKFNADGSFNLDAFTVSNSDGAFIQAFQQAQGTTSLKTFRVGSDSIGEGQTQTGTLKVYGADPLYNLLPAIDVERGNVVIADRISAGSLATDTHTFTGNVDVTGNIEVSGNLNYRNVEDLYVRDQSITLNANAATNATVEIIANRPQNTSTLLRWNETADKWQFTNDGSTFYDIPTSTSDLAEGTNLYYTDARFDTRLATKSTTDLAEGTNLYYTDSRVQSKIDSYVLGSENITVTSGVLATTSALGNTNSLTAQSGSGLTFNSDDGTIVTSKFGINSTVTETANIAGKGFGVFNYSNGLSTTISYSGTDSLEWYEIDGSVVSGSTTMTITSVVRGIDSTTAAVSDIIVGQVIANGTSASTPGSTDLIIFPDDAYVVSVDSGAGTVEMSQPATQTTSFTHTTDGIILDAGLVDTTTGLVIKLLSQLRSLGSGSDSALFFRSVRNTPFGYPASGPVPTDFDIITAGTASDYSMTLSTFMIGQTPVTNDITVLNAPKGITIGENTQLTNRGENDQVGCFGMNLMWDGLTSATNPIQPQMLFKSYTDNTEQGEVGSISGGGPRLFFTSANGNSNDNAFDTYPRANQELGRISFWGTTGEQLTPSSYSVPSYMSVQAADDWDTWGGGVAGNTDVYMASTAGGQAQTYLAFKNGELYLTGSNSNPVTFAPAQSASGFRPELAYDGSTTLWANINYANTGTNAGAKFTVTNGDSVDAGVVGDMQIALKRNDNSSNLTTPVRSILSGSASGSLENGKIVFTFDDDGSIGSTLNGLAATVSAPSTIDESIYNGGPFYGSGNETALGSNVYDLSFAFSFSGVAYYYILSGGSRVSYTDIGGTDPYYFVTQTLGMTVTTVVSSGVTAKEWKFNLEEQSDDLKIQSDGTTVMHFTDQRVFIDEVFRLHNLTTTEINALPSPQSGDTVYNTTLNQVCFYNGTAWQKITSATM